jgi:hypothetical protein
VLGPFDGGLGIVGLAISAAVPISDDMLSMSANGTTAQPRE